MLLEAKNLSKTFKKGDYFIKVLDNFNFEVDKGDFIAIVGPSGAGKSTLLHILGGLEKPDNGFVLLNGENIYKDEKELDNIRNQYFGFVFQFHYLLDDFTAIENVALPAMITGKKDEAFNKAKAILEKMGLINRLNHFPNELSGGEQQRVAIARALINDPLIIFADEPTGNLDKENSKIVIDEFKRLNEQGITILMVTHDEHIASQAKKILRLEKA
ncbi:lipoprotein-releasing system ATP-binding protein [Deferribacter desulfuricans SSM1]|uniref:Lipoprotein-releasing system ATP-binding protein n=1 Tax=Deferribacter desulfuricans (strain DSM 14783 / JCM 11476 / NBRC 101012 / SSM1) TaxID=639282 RepID=D3PBJ3_DEFDS|nr:ABC transporter ATP-binding protein [Deferribacter desulfuricans]BAI79966.1 lipoprotein-releasing system ATP-binding protein [Deferribacter desulfuricans SSM1]